MSLWWAIPSVALCCFVLSVLLMTLGGQTLLDQPVARSAHKTAVPRGGGAAIVISFGLFVALIASNDWLPVFYLAPLACALPVALTGFVDDLRPLPVSARLIVQLGSALLALHLLGLSQHALFAGWRLIPGWLQFLIASLAVVWVVNLYNFMDGIDTLAAGQCLFVSAAAGYLLALQANPLAWVCAGLFSATLGFLVLNLPPAKLFMGDAGSTFLGFTLAILAVASQQSNGLSVWVWVILMGSFIADTSYTLLLRWQRGLSVTEGHSMHAYQHLARRFRSHSRVSLLVMGINIVWLLPLAWLAEQYSQYGLWLAIAGVLPLMVLAGLAGAGKDPVLSPGT